MSQDMRCVTGDGLALVANVAGYALRDR